MEKVIQRHVFCGVVRLNDKCFCFVLFLWMIFKYEVRRTKRTRDSNQLLKNDSEIQNSG